MFSNSALDSSVWLTTRTTALPRANEHRSNYTKREVGGDGVGHRFGLTKYGSEWICHIYTYKFLYHNKTNITITINIPVPSNTVHFFLLSNFMIVWTMRGQWRVRFFV